MAIEARFEVRGQTELINAMKRVPDASERVINEVLHGRGGKAIMNSVLRFMPVSNKKKGPHAKFSKSLKLQPGNLSVTVTRATKRWNYLVFPNDGIGIRQRRKGPQMFFERGLDAQSDQVTNMLLDALNKVQL